MNLASYKAERRRQAGHEHKLYKQCLKKVSAYEQLRKRSSLGVNPGRSQACIWLSSAMTSNACSHIRT